jgi:hypothetical protein
MKGVMIIQKPCFVKEMMMKKNFLSLFVFLTKLLTNELVADMSGILYNDSVREDNEMKTGPVRLLCIVGIWIWSVFLFGQEIQMELPVKYQSGGRQATKPLMRDFELIINNVPRPILNLIECRDVLKEAGDLKRNIVLSFHVSEYNQRIAGAIAHFVYRILQPGDHLIVLSPLKSHPVNIGGNKEKVILDIENVLKPECESFRKYHVAAEKKLKSMLHKLNQVIKDDSRSSSYDVQRYKDINMFLNVYPQEIEKYGRTYLIPRIEKYNQILEQFTGRGGIRWWIHFHQRETGDLLSATRRMINRINDYFKDHVAHFSRLISNLEHALNLSESFPSQRMQNSLVGENVCYNVVFFGGAKNSQQDTLLANSTGFVKEMADVSRNCGGRTVVSVDPQDGIREIEDHTFSFLKLVYRFNGRTEPKSISVNWANQNKLVYKETFTAEEIGARINFLKHEMVSINDFILKERKVSFSISRFKLETRQQVGILKVRISLKDSRGKVHYGMEKILRATRDRITLALELPATGERILNLKIGVIDLIGNNRTVIEKVVGL